jgi:hypothetical protein
VSENALYYTFSTIAQTLAAAFGILTAIVVVRLPTLENAVENAKAIILTHHGDANYETAWTALRQHGLSGYRAAGFRVEGHLVNMQLAVAHRAWVSWGKLISSVRLAMIPTGADIAACFLALPVVPWLAPKPTWAWTAVVLTVATAVLCIVSYGWLVTRLVGQRVP